MPPTCQAVAYPRTIASVTVLVVLTNTLLQFLDGLACKDILFDHVFGV